MDPRQPSDVAEPTDDTEGHRLGANDSEVVVDDDVADVEGHKLAANDNEVVVDD